MASSSNQSQQTPCPVFNGENYDFWCVKMKTQLISDGLWEYVEEGFEEPQDDETLTIAQMQKLREQRKMDAKALSKIQLGLADSIFSRIINKTKAKDL